MTSIAMKFAVLPAFLLGMAACNQADEEPALKVAPPPTSAPEAPVEIIPSFDKWTIREGATVTEITEAVDGITGPIHKITLSEGGSLFGFNSEESIVAGDTITVRLKAWADEANTEGRFRIARYCGGENNEQSVASFRLQTSPITTSVSHTFEYDQPCARFQIDSRDAEVAFYVAEIEVQKK